MDDLEYLSELGYSKVAVTEQDVEALKNLIKAKTRSVNTNPYGISFLLGLFLAEVLFFAYYNREVIYPVLPDKPEISVNTTLPSETKIAVIKLDTVELTDDNFRRLHRDVKTTQTFDTLTALPGNNDTLELVNLAPHNVAEKGIETNNSDKLKFAINSPITYLHDLKITDYQKLYFKRVFTTHETGIPAAFADRDDMWSGQARLKANATDYLHEEISRAMNHFRKRDYNACIYSLNLVSGFNDNDVNCSFYLGMCYYYKTNYDKAQLYFNQCLENANNAFYQEARYYKALALSESGNSAGAASLLKQISDEEDFYSLKAKEFLGRTK